MTPDTRGLWPPSFQDNTVGAEEKMQCTELEARFQAMKWAVGNMAAVRWEWTTQGPQIGREETQKGYLKEQLCPSVTTHVGPLALSWQASMEGLLYQKPVPLILTGNLLWQSRLVKVSGMPFSRVYRKSNTFEKLLGNTWRIKWDCSPGKTCTWYSPAKYAIDEFWYLMGQSLLPETGWCVLTHW